MLLFLTFGDEGGSAVVRRMLGVFVQIISWLSVAACGPCTFKDISGLSVIDGWWIDSCISRVIDRLIPDFLELLMGLLEEVQSLFISAVYGSLSRSCNVIIKCVEGHGAAFSINKLTMELHDLKHFIIHCDQLQIHQSRTQPTGCADQTFGQNQACSFHSPSLFAKLS